MKLYRITRTRLVTERFKVYDETEDGALEVLADEMDIPSVTVNCECLEVSTHDSQVEITSVEEVEG